MEKHATNKLFQTDRRKSNVTKEKIYLPWENSKLKFPQKKSHCGNQKDHCLKARGFLVLMPWTVSKLPQKIIQFGMRQKLILGLTVSKPEFDVFPLIFFNKQRKPNDNLVQTVAIQNSTEENPLNLTVFGLCHLSLQVHCETRLFFTRTVELHPKFHTRQSTNGRFWTVCSVFKRISTLLTIFNEDCVLNSTENPLKLTCSDCVHCTQTNFHSTFYPH